MGLSCCKNNNTEPVRRNQGEQGGQKQNAASKKCKKIFKEQLENFRLNNQIDLHGLFVKEALQLIEQLLSQRVKELRSSNSSKKSDVIVITGKGIHSDGGVAKIRPAVERFLTIKGYSYDEVKNNHGRLLVHLSTKRN